MKKTSVWNQQRGKKRVSGEQTLLRGTRIRETERGREGVQVPLCSKMLRYLLKTLLQMNLFTDTIRNPSNGTDPFFNVSLPSFNSSLLDWGNFSGFNGRWLDSFCMLPFASSPLSSSVQQLLGFPLARLGPEVRTCAFPWQKDRIHLQGEAFWDGNVEMSWRGSWMGKVEGVVRRVRRFQMNRCNTVVIRCKMGSENPRNHHLKYDS